MAWVRVHPTDALRPYYSASDNGIYAGDLIKVGNNYYWFLFNYSGSDSVNNVLLVYKSTNNGSSWTKVSTVAGTTLTGSVGADFVRGDVDSTGKIHLIVHGYYTANPFYNVFDTTTDTWVNGTPWESISTTAPSSEADQFDIAVDSNNKPHVLYHMGVVSMGGSYHNIHYTNRVSGAWSAGVQVSVTTLGQYHFPHLVIKSDNTIITVYWNTTNSTLYRRDCVSGVWGSESTWTTWGTLVANIRRPLQLSPVNEAVYIYGSGSSGNVLENGVATNVSVGRTFINPVLISNAGALERYILYLSEGASPYYEDFFYFVKNIGAGWVAQTEIDHNMYTMGLLCPSSKGMVNPAGIMSGAHGFDAAPLPLLNYAKTWWMSFANSIVVTPDPAAFGLGAFSPSIPIWPAAAKFGLGATDPTVVLGNPVPYMVVGYLRIEHVMGAGITVIPAAASFGIKAVTPTIKWGYWVTPPAASFGIGAADPVTLLGSIIVDLVNHSAAFGIKASGPTIVLSSLTLDLSSSPAAFGIGGVNPNVPIPGAYYGTLKMWNGLTWVKVPLKVYVGGNYVIKSLKVWLEDAWQEIDING